MNYTLNLFAHLLERPPIGLPPEIATKGQEAVQQLAASRASEQSAEQALALFGIEAWPYWQAEREFLEHMGGKKNMFLNHLPASLHDKWGAFERSGGSIHNFREGEAFENAFTPEENQQIEKAMIDAHMAMREEAKQRAHGERKASYDRLVQEHIQEREYMLAALQELAALKNAGEKWDAEIDDAVAYFKRGFAQLEPTPTLEKIQGKINWYRGQIESGEK